MASNDENRYSEGSDFRIVLIGKTVTGKSALGNTILGKKVFEISQAESAHTKTCQNGRAEFEGHKLTVIDTPGFFDTKVSLDEVKTEIVKCMSFAPPGPHVVLVVIQAGRFTDEEKETMTLIKEVFGPGSDAYTIALFTHGDDVKANQTPIQDVIEGSPELKDFVGQCGGGHHVFNNRDKNPSQVQGLLEKIKEMYKKNKVEKGTDFQIVLVGKTGVGKSATGNTILGKKVFEVSFGTRSKTQVCQKEKAEFEGQTLAVVDTPGLVVKEKSYAELNKEIHMAEYSAVNEKKRFARCLSFAAPGPHAILAVIQAGRFTKEDRKSLERIKEVFGPEGGTYTIALFTHGDDIQADESTVEKMMEESQELKDFVSQCHGGVHVMDNSTENPSQIRELLEKIKQMQEKLHKDEQSDKENVSKNDMLEKAEEATDKPDQEKETPDKPDKERFFQNDELVKAEEAIVSATQEILKKDPAVSPMEARERAERDNAFLTKFDKDLDFWTSMGHTSGQVAGLVAKAALDQAAKNCCIQ